MGIMRLTKAKKSDFSNIYSHMERNFIRDEIRDYEDAIRIFDNKKYSIFQIFKDDLAVGFMCLWSLNGFSFLEHFVVYDEFRGKGYGSEALELLKKRCELLVLECEPPENAQQIRRVEFYKRHGMIINEYEYWQPSYRVDGQRCYLKLMSTQKLISFEDTVKEIYSEVYQTKYE